MMLLDRSRLDLGRTFEFVDRPEPGTAKPRREEDDSDGEDERDGDDGG
jgi:hypothetical protein